MPFDYNSDFSSSGACGCGFCGTATCDCFSPDYVANLDFARPDIVRAATSVFHYHLISSQLNAMYGGNAHLAFDEVFMCELKLECADSAYLALCQFISACEGEVFDDVPRLDIDQFRRDVADGLPCDDYVSVVKAYAK